MPGSLTVPLKVPLTGDRRTSKYSATEGECFAVVSFVEHSGLTCAEILSLWRWITGLSRVDDQ